MGTMTWIYQDYPLPKPPPPREPWPEWDFMAERSTGLESHRQPEPGPSVTLGADAHKEAVMLAAACNRVPDDGAHDTKRGPSDACLFQCRKAKERTSRVVPRCKPDDRADPRTNQ